MPQVENIVKKYRALTQIPTILSAKFMQNESVINTVWSRRNIELGKSTKSFVSYNINSQLDVVAQTIALDVSNELISKLSPSGKYRAVIRECETKDGLKQFLEIWEQLILTHCVDLNAADEHSDVYTDGEFGSFEWSPDETKLIYIAEKKNAKLEAYYKRKSKSDDNDDNKGKEYLYKQDWGEQLVSKKQSVIGMYDLRDDSVHVLDGVPENVCPAQVIWAADGKHLFGIALKTEPRKLGLIYCSNRSSTIFSLDLQENYVEISLSNKAVKSPALTTDGSELVWLQRDAGGPHAATMSLVKTSIPVTTKSNVETIVDIVQTEIRIKNDRSFYGLYTNKFPNRCWASERRLLLSTNQRNSIQSYIIDIDSGIITELPCNNDSLIILDVSNDVVLAAQRNLLMPDRLVIGKLPSKCNETSIEWKKVTESNVINGLDNFTSYNLDIEQDNAEDVSKFTAIYLGPKSAPERSVPLIVWPHGGPHSAYATGYSLEASLFMQMGYAVLLVNYRGSIGAGEKSVHYLLGRIGKSDVADCISATKEALTKFDWLDKDKLILVGGSHGGFLVTHLSGQFPDMFKAVIARNPVIDVASMSIISDIPDWCYVEAGSEYSQIGEPDNDVLLKMRKSSPIQHAHKVKAPTLLQIGSKDLRVPAYQAIDYYHRLKANNVPVEMNLYEDNHPLGLVPNEMNNIISSVLWIEKYLNNK